jgi:hypothetical protein
LAGTTLGSACRVSDCPCHSCGNSFSSFYKTSTLALDLNHLHSFIKALRDEPALIQCSIFLQIFNGHFLAPFAFVTFVVRSAWTNNLSRFHNKFRAR